MNIVEVIDVTYKYPDNSKFILKNMDLTIHKGDFVGLVGANGSGKSTLLKLILGLYKPISGKILVWGHSPAQVSSKIGYVSQYEDIDFRFPITLFEVVQMGLVRGSLINKFNNDDAKKVELILKELGIWDLQDQLISEVSGGQKQRAFLARALISDPELVILDEPLANLDIKSQKSFFSLLKQLNKDKKTIIVVDHNIELLAEYSTKIVCVDKCENNKLKVHDDNLHKLLKINGNS